MNGPMMKGIAKRLAKLLWLLPVALPLHAAAETVEYFHTDALGTPIAVTDASGNLIETSEYEPYGKLLNRPLTDGPGFTGHVQDAATGLTYMQQRYYDPVIGRMLSTDPINVNPGNGEGFNRYAYTANNPYRFKDPDGRCEKPTGSNICGRGLAWSAGPADGAVGSHRPVNFTKKPEVSLSTETYSKVSDTADNFNEKTGKKLVVTDGERTPKDQAKRMAYKIANGAGVKEYGNKNAANAILAAYTNAVANGADPVAAMAEKIQEQVSEGVYISRHLSGAGADFRDRDLSQKDKSNLRESAVEAGAKNVLREGIPPHTHVEY